MALAWVLTFALGYSQAFTVSGINSEEACLALGKKIAAEWTMPAPQFKCFSYEPRR